MASWAEGARGGTRTKPKLCPAFKPRIVVCEKKTHYKFALYLLGRRLEEGKKPPLSLMASEGACPAWAP